MVGTKTVELHESDYFGESALLIAESRGFSVIAAGSVKCATVDRAAFEATIGNLSSIIAEDKRRKDERSSALSGAGPPLTALKKLGAVAVDEFSSTVVCRIEGDSSGQVNHTLRVLYKKAVAETKHQESVMKEMDLLKSLSKQSQFSNCVSLPSLQSTYTDSNCLYALYEEPICCSIACVNDELNGKWDESCIKHITMCVLLGLEAVHANGVVYRGISPETLLLSKDGNVILSNFQYARQNLEGNVTICGAPEYLAPEVVQQQGHGLPSDYWQLGVVLYELLQGKSPFFAKNELDVYAKICRHRQGTLASTVEPGTPLSGKGIPKFLAFLEKSIHPDLALRINDEQAKKDSWFSNSDWKKLSCSKITKICDQQMQQRLATEDESEGDMKGGKYGGDNNWCDGW
jgi:serine/threonine protein kinase